MSTPVVSELELVRIPVPPRQAGVTYADKEHLLAYLGTQPFVWAAQHVVVDRFDSARTVTVTHRTDGVHLWSSETAEYLDRYDQPLPASLLAAAREWDGTRALDVSTRARAIGLRMLTHPEEFSS